jgi:hypothetical protein
VQALSAERVSIKLCVVLELGGQRCGCRGFPEGWHRNPLLLDFTIKGKKTTQRVEPNLWSSFLAE